MVVSSPRKGVHQLALSLNRVWKVELQAACYLVSSHDTPNDTRTTLLLKTAGHCPSMILRRIQKALLAVRARLQLDTDSMARRFISWEDSQNASLDELVANNSSNLIYFTTWKQIVNAMVCSAYINQDFTFWPKFIGDAVRLCNSLMVINLDFQLFGKMPYSLNLQEVSMPISLAAVTIFHVMTWTELHSLYMSMLQDDIAQHSLSS